MARTITSDSVVFLDNTDNRKLEVYISSNLPTVQIKNPNTNTYTPDWTSTPLNLEAKVYLDSQDVTDTSTIIWYKKNSVGVETQIATNSKVVNINTNDLDGGQLITYVCKVSYQASALDAGLEDTEQITFSQISTGQDGTNGTSVNIKGTADGVSENPVGSDGYIITVNGSVHVSSSSSYGDAYIYDGYLYVRTGSQQITNVLYYAIYTKVGQIQGPKGEDAKNIVLTGNSHVFKVDKDGNVTPQKITVTSTATNTTITEWSYSINGGAFQVTSPSYVVNPLGNLPVIDGEKFDSNSLSIRVSDGTYSDVFTIYKVYDGEDGATGPQGEHVSIAFLTNENVSFGANAGGEVSATNFSTNVVAYTGTTKVAPTINVDAITGLPSGMTVSVQAAENNEQTLTFSIANNATLGSMYSNHGTINIPITSPVEANLMLSWSKINTGATGATGNNGADAYTVLLTNESHTFAGGVDSAVSGGEANTQVLAYLGTTQKSISNIVVNGKTASTSSTDTGISGLKFKCNKTSGTNVEITFACTNELTSGGSIPVQFKVGNLTFTKMFTYAIAFRGNDGKTGNVGNTGAPATAYWLISNASVVQKTAAGAMTPSELTFTGKSQTGTNAPTNYACRWIISYTTNGTDYIDFTQDTVNNETKSVTVLSTYKAIRARMYLAGGTTTLLDEQIIPVVSDGAKGDKGNTGDRGAGINSVTVTYGTSTAATTQPTTWQSTLPTVAEGSYLWTKTVTDYTDDAIADTVTLTYAKQGAKGSTGTAGTSVTVSSIQYQAGTSATTAPTGTWSDTVVSVSAGSYLWTKTTFSDGKIGYGVARQGSNGAKGDAGTDAYTVLLSNESHVFAGSTSSAVAATATTQILAYKGTTAQSVTITSVNGVAASTASTDTGITGLSFACSALSGTAPMITFTCTTSFVSQSGIIPIVLSVGGVSITKMFTYSIAFKGATGGSGSAATSYWLISSASVVQKSVSGSVVLNPSTLTFTGKSKTGTSAPADYKCRWIIAYSTDGSTYTNSYTSSADEASKTFTVDATYKSVRVRMYLAGGTSTLLDEQIIPVVTDGAVGTPGMDAVTFQIYSTNGYALSTSTPAVTLQTFAYVGDVAITAGATYQWYSYSESGWSTISNATNAYLTISRDDVSFSKSYMCKMTFGGVTYASVATIDDKNDENKLFTTKPSSYTVGDIWIVGSDYIPSGVEVGTMLRAQYTRATYDAGDWIEATKYDRQLKDIQEDLTKYNQYFSFNSTDGIKITAKDSNGAESKYSTTISNDKWAINYGSEAVTYVDETKMHIKEAEIESPLTITGKYSGSTMLQAPIMNIGNFSIVVESNGSLSVVVKA